MNARPDATRTLHVEALARVEGEGALFVQVRDGRVADVQLKIFEPPRFFEALLRGRLFTEAPDITARICGICPVAYQMGAAQAMEAICGVEVGDGLRALRHLLYCGEWIESHALHIFMLHLPDFLGYPDVVQMAKDHSALVERGLMIKKTGNRLMALLGGREVHPINPRVGGFFSVPGREDLAPLEEPLGLARDAALETLRRAAAFDFPDVERDYEFVALRHAHEYAILDGRLVSSRGLDVPIDALLEHVEEEQVPHSTALRGVMKEGGPYVVGPLARFSLNADRLAPPAREAARQAGLEPPCRNPFKSILVRLVEIVHACDTALQLIRGYAPPETPFVNVSPRAGTGYGCTEAPRGICWHRYRIDDDGVIRDARIIPPTSQNLSMIENDLRHVVAHHLALPDDELQWTCEQAIRNYDPCISCSTHFLQLVVDRA